MTRTCVVCGKEFEPGHEWYTFCGECYETKRENRFEPKACAYCGKVFNPHHHRQKYCCGECRKAATKIYQKEYREGHKEQRKEYLEINKRKLQKYNREYYMSHYSERTAYRKRYNETHREENKEYCRRYKREHREEIRQQRHYSRTVKPKIEACRKEHNGCFDCPTEDGECLYE